MKNIQDALDEIAEMSRDELVRTRDELIKDTELPKKERNKLLSTVENRLYELKNGKPPPDSTVKPCYFASFESDGEKLSVLTHKSLGQFILAIEPEIVYSHAKISHDEFEQLKGLNYGEI